MPAIVLMFATHCCHAGDRNRHGIVCSIAAWLLLLAPLFSAPLLRAQPSDTILSNPKAVLLHRIWMVRGSVTGQDRVGEGAGAIGDIDGDSISEFAVRYGRLWQWRVYKGARPAPDTNPMWTLDSAAAEPMYPVVGDFWGTGHRALGFGVFFPSVPFDERFFFSIYRTEGGTIADTPAVMLDPYRTFSPPVTPGIRDIRAADLDGDGADELIVAVYRMYRGTQEVRNAELWIFKGGPNFQVDTPTVILRDPVENDGDRIYVSLADFDGDGHPDLLLGGGYVAGEALKFWFGDAGPLSGWAGRGPDRVIELDDEHPKIGGGITVLDCDGDRAADILIGSADGPRLYRSNAGKDIHTRNMKNADADHHFRRKDFGSFGNGGYMNDATRRFAMPAIFGPNPTRTSAMITLFNSSENGPDSTYEAYYAADMDGLIEGSVFNIDAPVGDCNGDGWDDYLAANSTWYGFYQGIAVVLAGGPYIPQDSATLGVRDVAVAGRADAVSIWPNPMRDELHIAWRGDLARMPARFAVYDALGRLVARGDVAPWRGEAVLQCPGLAAGAYLLSVQDASGWEIVSVALMRE